MKIYSVILLFVAHKTWARSFDSDNFKCPGNGLFADPDNCQCFYDCANLTPFHECCGVGTYFDAKFKICNYINMVNCGDRPLPGSTRPPKTTPHPTTPRPTTARPTTALPTTARPTTAIPTTARPTTAIPTTARPTTARPTTSTTVAKTTSHNTDVIGFPEKVLGMYILLADDFHEGYHSNAEWIPRLHEYQQLGVNVLFFTFINPGTMEVPLAFKKLAATRGTGIEGAVPEDTLIIFAIGGYAYSQEPDPWDWLTSLESASIMAEKVAGWKQEFGIDGIDLDIENGAGDHPETGRYLLHFIHQLKELEPSMIVSQPTYGYPQVQAEIDVINGGWSLEADRSEEADSIGIMVYDGTQALDYVKNYAEATSQWEGFPIQVDVPRHDILLGCKGSASGSDISALADAAVNDNMLGIMVWYASVVNGFAYEADWDASESLESQESFVDAMELFYENM